MLEKEKTSSSLEKRGIASVLLSVGLLKEQIAEWDDSWVFFVKMLCCKSEFGFFKIRVWFCHGNLICKNRRKSEFPKLVWLSKLKQPCIFEITVIFPELRLASKKNNAVSILQVVLLFSSSVSSKKRNKRSKQLLKQRRLIPTPPWTICTWTCTLMIAWMVTWSVAVTTGLGTRPIRHNLY